MKVYIIGASGLAKEVANYILDVDFEIEGFVERDEVYTEQTLQIRNSIYPIIKESAFFEFVQNSEQKIAIVIGVGFPRLRKEIYDNYKDYCDFPNIIHPKAILCDTSIEMGIGNVITPGCIFTTSIKIGDLNFFNLALSIGHDVNIGNYNVFNPCVSISGNIHIGNGNLIGCNAAVIQGVEIGNGNSVGMGAVVLQNIKDCLTLVGVPAKPIVK